MPRRRSVTRLRRAQPFACSARSRVTLVRVNRPSPSQRPSTPRKFQCRRLLSPDAIRKRFRRRHARASPIRPRGRSRSSVPIRSGRRGWRAIIAPPRLKTVRHFKNRAVTYLTLAKGSAKDRAFFKGRQRGGGAIVRLRQGDDLCRAAAPRRVRGRRHGKGV